MLCGLRTKDGISLDDPFIGKFSQKEAFAVAVDESLQDQWLVVENNHLRPTPLGMRFADSLAQLFFRVE